MVADDLAFPDGMAITKDGETLIVAKSHGQRLTAYDIDRDGDLGNQRVWADTGKDHPDRSASTPKGLSGTPMLRSATACGYERVARSSPQLNSAGGSKTHRAGLRVPYTSTRRRQTIINPWRRRSLETIVLRVGSRCGDRIYFRDVWANL